MEDYTKLVKLLSSRGIDVSLLVINAGSISKGKLENVSGRELSELMDVNMYHPTAMLKKFLPLLQNREEKSGIIVVSSVAGDSPIPALTTYSASKAYLSYLSAAVDQEIQADEKSKIDMQVLCPYFVATDMVSDVSIPLSFLTVASAESVVKSSLR